MPLAFTQEDFRVINLIERRLDHFVVEGAQQLTQTQYIKRKNIENATQYLMAKKLLK